MNAALNDPVVLAVLVLGGLGLFFGILLGISAVLFRPKGNPLVEQINDILPQTQCGQCGFPGCRPYAEAIAAGEAQINRCPPGGAQGITQLADLLDVEPLPLNAEHGTEAPPTVAYIREDECIGCTKCIQACPVDAILGAARLMHTIIADECTGCDLCVDPCPVNCIEMVLRDQPTDNWQWTLPAAPNAVTLIATDAERVD